MIDQGSLQNWDGIFARAGLKPLRRGRGQCPFCSSSDGFSAGEGEGLYHCFACNVGGDKIDFIKRLYQIDFKGALAFFGLHRSCPATLNPEVQAARQRERRLRRGLDRECRRIGRNLRDEHYFRTRILSYAEKRLCLNREDEMGWRLAEIGYKGVALEELERWLDRIDIGSDEQKLWAWRVLREMEKFYE